MARLASILRGAALVAVALALAPAAMAQATRTWVSGVGDDANPCSRTAPCKTFAGAISKTAPNGVISVLDPGGFGAVTITKSITIEGQDIAGVLSSSTNGINVNGAGITVTLRNLEIEGTDTGLIGINYVNGARLNIDNCRIFGFRASSARGISMTAGGQLMVKNSSIYDNGTSVVLDTSSFGIVATLDNVSITDTSTAGILISGAGPVFMNVKRSTVSSNSGHGINVMSTSTAITVTDSSLNYNGGTALNAGISGAFIRISGNTIVDNAATLGIVSGATIASDGTNRISGPGATPTAVFANQ